MNLPDGLPSTPLPVEEIERKLRWRLLPALGFLALMVFLLTVAVVGMRAPQHPVFGLPDDPDVRAAQALVCGRLPVATGGLRLRTDLLGEAGAEIQAGVADFARADRAEVSLRAALARAPRDPRLLAALGHLDLARRRYGAAEAHYRAALGGGAHCGEARLGLAVALALRAAAEPHPYLARGLTLRAIAQCAAVLKGDPAYEAALYDRALLLAAVDRRAEAEGCVAEYLARDSVSAWAGRLAAAVGAAP